MARKSAARTVDITAGQTSTYTPLAFGERLVSSVFADTEDGKTAPSGAIIRMGSPYTVASRLLVPDPAYTWVKDTMKAAQMICSGAVAKNWLIDGPPGCGKTEFAYQLASRTGRAITVIECHEGIEADSMFSSLEPSDETKSGFKRVAGPIANAMVAGDLLVLDELKGLRPAVQMALYNLLDGRPVQIRHSGETVTPHEDFRVIATVNDVADEKRSSFKGAFPLTDPLKSRFAALRFAPLSPPEEMKALVARAVGLSPKMAKYLVTIANVVRAEAIGGMMREFSFRELIVAGRLLVAERGPASGIADEASADASRQWLSLDKAVFVAYCDKEGSSVSPRLKQIIADHKSLMTE